MIKYENAHFTVHSVTLLFWLEFPYRVHSVIFPELCSSPRCRRKEPDQGLQSKKKVGSLKVSAQTKAAVASSIPAMNKVQHIL